MTPNPILKVLSLIQSNRIKTLVMGGQACVLYGAAEFSRDLDLVFLSEDENLGNFQKILKELDAECIAVPDFDRQYLDRGHAVHFRCKHPKLESLRHEKRKGKGKE